MTTFATFNDAVLSASTIALHNYVLPSISTWLQANKGITVTATELAGALQIQAPTRNIVVGTASPVTAPIPATGGRKKADTKAPEVVAPGQGCIRIPKNTGPAEKRGVPCNKPRMDGKMYCKVCNFLKSGGNETKTGDKAVKEEKKTGGLTTAPPPQEQTHVENTDVNAHELKKYPGYYMEDVCRLLFKIIGEGEDFIYYAKLSQDETKIVRLVESDKIYAKELGMKCATKADEDREFEILTKLCADANVGLQLAPVPQIPALAQVLQQTPVQPPITVGHVPIQQTFQQVPMPQPIPIPQPIPMPQQSPQQGFPQQIPYAQQGFPQQTYVPNTGVYNPNTTIPTFAPNFSAVPQVGF